MSRLRRTMFATTSSLDRPFSSQNLSVFCRICLLGDMCYARERDNIKGLPHGEVPRHMLRGNLESRYAGGGDLPLQLPVSTRSSHSFSHCCRRAAAVARLPFVLAALPGYISATHMRLAHAPVGSVMPAWQPVSCMRKQRKISQTQVCFACRALPIERADRRVCLPRLALALLAKRDDWHSGYEALENVAARACMRPLYCDSPPDGNNRKNWSAPDGPAAEPRCASRAAEQLRSQSSRLVPRRGRARRTEEANDGGAWARSEQAIQKDPKGKSVPQPPTPGLAAAWPKPANQLVRHESPGPKLSAAARELAAALPAPGTAKTLAEFHN